MVNSHRFTGLVSGLAYVRVAYDDFLKRAAALGQIAEVSAMHLSPAPDAAGPAFIAVLDVSYTVPEKDTGSACVLTDELDANSSYPEPNIERGAE